MRAFVGFVFSVLLLASPAVACSVAVAFPEPGETWEAAQYREELARQQKSWDQAGGVFLVRVSRERSMEKPPRGTVIATLKGYFGPREIDLLGVCAPLGIGDVLIVTARREGLGWRSTDTMAPSQVRDPRLVQALKDAAERLTRRARR